MEGDPNAEPGLTDVDRVVREELARYIHSAPYPANREQLVATAQDNGAPDHWLTVLEHLPPDYRFHDPQEVAASLGYGYRPRPH